MASDGSCTRGAVTGDTHKCIKRRGEKIGHKPANLRGLFQLLISAMRDLAPIVLVIAFFQIIVLQQPFPNLDRTVIGLGFVVVGLALFVRGLEMGLFSLGETMAHAFARKGSLSALLAFAFCLGFGTTVAEPALIAVADEAAKVRADSGT